MRYETYTFMSRDSLITFEFTSVGPKGPITKRVQYQKMSPDDNIYNLAFGDVNPVTNEIDDRIITNNNDTEKVLATVAATVYAFMNEYPEAAVYAKGSTGTRNRLYRIAISNNLDELRNDFIVYGLIGKTNWTIYERNMDYSAFLFIKIQ